MAESLKKGNVRVKSWIQYISAVLWILMIVMLSSVIRLRVDLTEDHRYTLSKSTKTILADLKNDIYIQVYLDGEMPVPMKRMKRSVMEMLDEFRIISGHKIDFEFINPFEGNDQVEKEKEYQSLVGKGLDPIILRSGDKEGGSAQKVIFPGMILNFNGTEVPVNFLNNSSSSYEQNILRSVEGLEYNMIQAIATLSSDTIYKVAFIEGHDEIPEIETADITYNLARFFTIDRGVIGGKTGVLDQYAAIVIAGPEKEFSESDKLVIDQYIMKGGKVLWLFDEVSVNSDSLVYGETVGLYRPLNIEDQLFRYGVRVNPVVVQDMECMLIQLAVRSGGAKPQFVPSPWLYYPLLNPSYTHPITRNINRVKGEFVNYIDTVGLDSRVNKKILLTTSEYSRILSPPMVISLKEAESVPNEKEFSKSNLSVAVLLEGNFTSAFQNRMITELADDKNFKSMTESVKTKMIVVADADIIRNGVRRVGKREVPLPLGQDKSSGQMFGNTDFIINCLNYLVDDKGLLDLRSREFKLRRLDQAKVQSERLKWQVINVIGPVLLVIIAGLLYSYIRKRKYSGI